jgi:hypothetical protein
LIGELESNNLPDRKETGEKRSFFTKLVYIVKGHEEVILKWTGLIPTNFVSLIAKLSL